MPNKRAGRAKKNQPRRFHRPLGLRYNEFVGELGPADDGFTTELHVRYGERDGLYLDWSITISMRKGSLAEYMASDSHRMERRPTRRFEVAGTSIREITYHPVLPPEVRVLRTLEAGDEAVVDQGYDEILTQLSQSWNNRFPDPDPHTVATFGFASNNRHPEFRDSRPYLTNTVVSIDPDVVEEVWIERGNAYFGNKLRSAAVWMPDRSEWRYLFGEEPDTTAPSRGSDDSNPISVHAIQVTMGMLADVINHDTQWSETPHQ
ncbi:hypothetical protein ACWEVD_28710 [Nocardia thailandica]